MGCGCGYLVVWVGVGTWDTHTTTHTHVVAYISLKLLPINKGVVPIPSMGVGRGSHPCALFKKLPISPTEAGMESIHTLNNHDAANAALSHFGNSAVAMDVYEINIKKASSKKEIELRLLEEGLKNWKKNHQDTEGFDADDDPDNLNIDILDDLDDDPDDFTKTSDTWTNSPKLTVIPLPSNLRVDQCRCCMAEDLILLEMLLREGQANDALHNLQIHLCNKAILF
ncbi:hypothetical protein EDB19DRAFT_1833352 [Suillus lakei]|nr:hypothetical protein EDB19DRAFT_1833352 [Suillus lakei]